MSSPWADPTLPIAPAEPYAGPPPSGPAGAAPNGNPARPQPPGHTAPAGHGPAGWPAPAGWPPPSSGWPAPSSGWPAYGWPASTGAGWGYGPPWAPMLPPPPRRPGQVIGAAVLAFVQAALVLIGSLYVFVLASMAGVAADQSIRAPGTLGRLATEGTIVAGLQLLSAVALVVAGLMALNRRRRSSWTVLLAALAGQLLLAGYWAIRLGALLDELPRANLSSVLVALTVLFSASPLVALGLVLVGPGRRWFADEDARGVRQPVAR